MDGKYFVHPKTSSNHWSLTLKFKKTRRNSKSGQVHKRTSYIDTQAILPPFLTVLFLAFSMTYTDPPINPKYTHTHTHTHTHAMSFLATSKNTVMVQALLLIKLF